MNRLQCYEYINTNIQQNKETQVHPRPYLVLITLNEAMDSTNQEQDKGIGQYGYLPTS